MIGKTYKEYKEDLNLSFRGGLIGGIIFSITILFPLFMWAFDLRQI